MISMEIFNKGSNFNSMNLMMRVQILLVQKALQWIWWAKIICIITKNLIIWLNKNIYLCHQHDYLLLTALGKQDLYQSNCHQTDTQSNKLVSPHVFRLEGTCCLNWLYGILATIALGWSTFSESLLRKNKTFIIISIIIKPHQIK